MLISRSSILLFNRSFITWPTNDWHLRVLRLLLRSSLFALLQQLNKLCFTLQSLNFVTSALTNKRHFTRSVRTVMAVDNPARSIIFVLSRDPPVFIYQTSPIFSIFFMFGPIRHRIFTALIGYFIARAYSCSSSFCE